MLFSAACAPRSTRARWTAPSTPTVRTAPFARLDAIGAGAWALVSTPLGGDRTTFANGGIIAGRTGVVVIEGFYRDAGAAWLAQQARELTGRWPTHVVLTHYYVDHASGVSAYADHVVRPTLHVTAPTRIDLGDRVVTLDPVHGHTSSDLIVHDQDAAITFSGDLVWNGMFPNYVDAQPIALHAQVDRLVSMVSKRQLLVPGHGAVKSTPCVNHRDPLLKQRVRDAAEAEERRF
ncbi:hypothetical protein [Gemmatimonas sp.]|uniref:hypothetical protein n=1 Tax=Gemmatimonas sp. TaxID=1962908 RepID=UPI0037BFC591